MKAAGITLSTVGAGGGANQVPLRKLARAGRRPLLRRREPVVHPRHLPQGDPAGLRPADRRGAVLPDPDLVVADPARDRRRLPELLGYNGTTAKAAAQTSSSPRATTRSSPSGSTASGGRWPGRPTPPAAGRRAGSAGTASRRSSARSSAGRSRARRAAGSRPPSRPRRTTALRVESVEDDGSPRDFYRDQVAVIGPDLAPATVDLAQVAPGVYEAPIGELDRGAYAVRVTQTQPGSTPLGGRWGWSHRPPPSTGCSARTSRSSRRCAATSGGAVEARPRPWIHDLRPRTGSPSLWPRLLVLALLLWPLDIALRRVSLGRRELADGRRWVAGRPWATRRTTDPADRRRPPASGPDRPGHERRSCAMARPAVEPVHDDVDRRTGRRSGRAHDRRRAPRSGAEGRAPVRGTRRRPPPPPVRSTTGPQPRRRRIGRTDESLGRRARPHPRTSRTSLARPLDEAKRLDRGLTPSRKRGGRRPRTGHDRRAKGEHRADPARTG